MMSSSSWAWHSSPREGSGLGKRWLSGASSVSPNFQVVPRRFRWALRRAILDSRCNNNSPGRLARNFTLGQQVGAPLSPSPRTHLGSRLSLANQVFSITRGPTPSATVCLSGQSEVT